MPALASPVSDERSALREYLSYHQNSYFAVAYGLTDAQARSTPTAGALSGGGLVKHVTAMQRDWMARVAGAPDAPPRDGRAVGRRLGQPRHRHAARLDGAGRRRAGRSTASRPTVRGASQGVLRQPRD